MLQGLVYQMFWNCRALKTKCGGFNSATDSFHYTEVSKGRPLNVSTIQIVSSDRGFLRRVVQGSLFKNRKKDNDNETLSIRYCLSLACSSCLPLLLVNDIIIIIIIIIVVVVVVVSNAYIVVQYSIQDLRLNNAENWALAVPR